MDFIQIKFINSYIDVYKKYSYLDLGQPIYGYMTCNW